MTYEALVELVRSIHSNMRATDFVHKIAIHHTDGSHFLFNHAVAAKHTITLSPEQRPKFTFSNSQDYLVVFTEHNGFHIFPEDSLTHYSQSSSGVPIKDLRS